MTRQKGSNPPEKLTVLGATGSIGTNTLDVIRQLGGRDRFEILALTGAGNVALLAEQARELGVKLAVTADDEKYAELKDALAGSGIAVASGKSGLQEAASLEAAAPISRSPIRSASSPAAMSSSPPCARAAAR